MGSKGVIHPHCAGLFVSFVVLLVALGDGMRMSLLFTASRSTSTDADLFSLL